MSDKLQTKDIAKYLPWGMKGIIYYSDDDTEICTLGLRDDLYNVCSIASFLDNTYITKPILRPISYLTQTIQFKGESVVPLIECAKLAYPNVKDWKFRCNELKSFECETGFYFDGKDFETFSTHNGKVQPTYNNYALFQLLDEMLIDYTGLIERGLAVDVNSLIDNVYEL